MRISLVFIFVFIRMFKLLSFCFLLSIIVSCNRNSPSPTPSIGVSFRTRLITFLTNDNYKSWKLHAVLDRKGADVTKICQLDDKFIFGKSGLFRSENGVDICNSQSDYNSIWKLKDVSIIIYKANMKDSSQYQMQLNNDSILNLYHYPSNTWDFDTIYKFVPN